MPASAHKTSIDTKELAELRERLREAEEVIHAIRLGEIDAVVAGTQVLTFGEQPDMPYRTLVETMREGALTVALDGTILFANPVMGEMLKVDPNVLIGQSLEEYLASATRKQWPAIMGRGARELFTAEGELQDEAGGTLAVQFKISPLRHEQVQAVSIIVADQTVVRNLADTNAQMAVERENRIRIGTILEGITDCYLLLDKELRFLDVNRRALELLFNSTRDAVTNRRLTDLDHEGHFKALEVRLRESFATGVAEHFELRAGPDARWFEVHAYPYGDHMLVYMRDIDDRKRAEGALVALNETLEQRIGERTAEAQERLQQLQALARQLMSAEQVERRKIATDLHDYLAQILVVCKLKLAKLDKYIDDVGAAEIFTDVNKFVDQALTYTRTLIAELSPTALQRAGLLAGLDVLAEKLQQLGLTLKITTDGEQEDLSENEAILLYQSIRELMLNVIKHAEVDEACVHCSWQPGLLRIDIKDEGKGFDLGQIRQAPSAEGKFGLLNVRERIEAIGAKFNLESAPGKGTLVTMEISLKRQEPEREAAQQPPLGLRAAQAADKQSLITVLLVDDHRMVREGLRSVIDSTPDLKVVGEASNGEEAVANAQQLNPQVVVMDVNMPRLNGIEATRRIKLRAPETVVIGLSIFDEDDVSQVMRQAGAATLMGKSRAADELCDLIRKYVAVNQV